MHKRFEIFLTLVGLRNERLLSRENGDLMTLMLSRAFKDNLKSIREALEPGYGAVWIPKFTAVDMVIGFDAKRHDQGAWECSELYQLADAEKIEELLLDIEDLETPERVKGNLCGGF